VAQTALAQIRPEGYFGGIRLLVADARVVSLLINDARCRTMERLFGIPRDEPSGLATLIALALLAEGFRTHAPHRPTGLSSTALAFGFGTVREAAYDVAGPWARESSYFGTLLAFALVGATARTITRRSVRGVKGLSHEAYGEFHHRYGHLIRPNRRRRAGAEPGSRERGTLPLSDM
jgi:hypothetical protein